jgi:hypothetical protein
MTEPYDAALSALRNHNDDLGVWLAIWEARSGPDAHARRCASDAVDAIDAALRELHQILQRLVGEIRKSDDAQRGAGRCPATRCWPEGCAPPPGAEGQRSATPCQRCPTERRCHPMSSRRRGNGGRARRRTGW